MLSVLICVGLIHTDDKIALQEIARTLRASDTTEEQTHVSLT